MLVLALLLLPLLTRAQTTYVYGPNVLPTATDYEYTYESTPLAGFWSHTVAPEGGTGPMYLYESSDNQGYTNIVNGYSYPIDFSGTLTSLTPGATYHYRQNVGPVVYRNGQALRDGNTFVADGTPQTLTFTLGPNAHSVTFTLNRMSVAEGSSCSTTGSAVQCDPTNGAQCVNGRCQVPLGSHCSSSSVCADGVQCSTADFCPTASPSFVTGCDNSCATDEASTCGGSGALCSVDMQCASGICYLGQCVSNHASSSGCSCTVDIQCNVGGGLRCGSGLCAMPGTLGDMCYSNGDCPFGGGCGNQQCGGLTAPCLANDGEVTGDTSACLSGYCNQQQCSARLPRGASCSNPYDCDTPDFDPSNPTLYVHCSSGICGGKYAFCPSSPSTDGQLDPDWCAAGLSCIANQCQLAPSAGSRRRRRQLTAGTMNQQRIWGSELDSSGLRCTGGSIKCPAGSGYECIDPSMNLESCGGCPGAGGVDCSALPHVGEVACVLGQCIVHRCMDGFTLSNQTCTM